MSNRNEKHHRRTAALAVFCRCCSSPLVQASGWTREDESRWKVRLWCPECWHEQTVSLDRAEAACLSLAIEEGFACALETFAGLDSIVTIEPDTRRRRDPI